MAQCSSRTFVYYSSSGDILSLLLGSCSLSETAMGCKRMLDNVEECSSEASAVLENSEKAHHVQRVQWLCEGITSSASANFIKMRYAFKNSCAGECWCVMSKFVECHF